MLSCSYMDENRGIGEGWAFINHLNGMAWKGV